MSSLAEKQIESEKKRLEEAKNIAESEKRLYVKVKHTKKWHSQSRGANWYGGVMAVEPHR